MKKKMSKTVGLLVAVAIFLSIVIPVYGANSINDDTRDITVVNDGVNEWNGVVTDKLDYSKIDNEMVRAIAEAVNQGEGMTPAEVAEALLSQQRMAQPIENYPTTTDGLSVNLKLYDFITDFVNVEVQGENQEVRLSIPAAVGLQASDVLLMHIDPVTGKISLILPKNFDSKTGEMTVVVPGSGIIALMQKIPIVVRDTHPDEYNNEAVAKAIKSLPQDRYLELSEWLKAFGVEGKTLKINDQVTVNVDDYSSANIPADLAVQFGLREFGYDLSTKINAKLFQQLSEIDYERILNYVGVDFDSEAIKNDRSILTGMAPVKLEKCFVYHVDATTGETNIAYEPTISFRPTEDLGDYEIKIWNETVHNETIDVKDKVSNVFSHTVFAEETGKEGLTDEQEEILKWKIKDIDNNDLDDMNIVIDHEEYFGMGPFLLLMPKNKTAAASGFPWWGGALIGVAVIGGGAAYMVKKNGKKDGAAE